MCNPFAGEFLKAKEPSDPLAELAPSSLDQLAFLLHLTQQPTTLSRPGSQGHNDLPTEEWRTRQLNSISRLPFELQRQLTLTNFLRLPKRTPPYLCHAHLGLNEHLIQWCYQMLKGECSTQFRRIRRWDSRHKDEHDARVAETLELTKAAEQYMESMEGSFSIPHRCPIPKLKRPCPACFLSLVGANTRLLVGLRANMLSRTKAETPRLLRLIDAWIATFESDQAASLKQESHSLAYKLAVIRASMKQRRDQKIAQESPEKAGERAKRERERLRGRTSRSSRGRGPPSDFNGASGHDTPRPPKTPSANPFVDPSDTSADAAVSAGANPEVMSAGRQDADGYTPSDMAQGYDGNGNFCHGYGMKRAPSRRDQAADRGRGSKKSTARGRKHDEGGKDAFENASAVPEPLRPTSQETSSRDINRTESVASRKTPRHQKAAAGTASAWPSTRSQTSPRRYSMDSYVPPRRSWKARQAPGPSKSTNLCGGRAEYPPNPFADAADEVSDLESEIDADADDALYTSEVETEFLARTVVPDAPSPPQQHQQQQSPETFGSSTARSQLRDDVASSVYSATPGQAPSSIGPRGGDASRWKRSRTASHHHRRRPGASSSSTLHQRAAAANTAASASGQLQQGRPNPTEYADIPAEMRARFGMHSSGDQSIAPGDSISAVGERLESRRRREREPRAAATHEKQKQQQQQATARPSWWKPWTHSRRKAAPPPPPPREKTKTKNQSTERQGGGGVEAGSAERRWRRMSDAETEWENLYRHFDS